MKPRLSIHRPRPAGRRRRAAGQGLVEFALVAPIFFLLLFSIIEFGRYVYYVQILNNAAREGTRYAIVCGSHSICSTGPPQSGTTSSDPTGQTVIDEVVKYSVGVIGGGSQITVTPTWPDGDNARDHRVTVTVAYNFQPLIPLVPLPTVQITGGSTLVINN